MEGNEALLCFALFSFHADGMLEYSWFVMLYSFQGAAACFSYAIVRSAYLFIIGCFWNSCYCRRLSKVPCAEHQVFADYLLEIQIYVYREGRKEEDNLMNYPLQISISVYIYITPDLLICHWPFTFSLWNTLHMNPQSLSLLWKLVPLYLFLNFAWKGHHMLFYSSVTSLGV